MAAEAAADDRPELLPVMARCVSVALSGDIDGAPCVRVLQSWALVQGPEAALAWLGPLWERWLSDPLQHDAWRRLARVDSLSETDRGTLARVILTAAAVPGVPPEGFRFGIEEIVLPLAEPVRPHDPSWPGSYLDRLPSDLALISRLFTTQRLPGLRQWLDQARRAGELSEGHIRRIAICQRYSQIMNARDETELSKLHLPDVRPDERGLILGQLLNRLGDGSDESIGLALSSCRAAWPGAFALGAPGIDALGAALARTIRGDRVHPEVWIERLTRMIRRLELDTIGPWRGFEPNGLAAAVAAASTRLEGDGFDPWKFRAFVLGHDHAWRILAADLGRDLQASPVDEALARCKRWDGALNKGRHTDRFFEVLLNQCEPRLLVAVVCDADLNKNFRNFKLAWWHAGMHEGASDDLRDRFARRRR